ncbi:MAG TPA: hypothetical protein P5163_00045 [Rubrivivax sp.]|nr:hypothetical protein [Rubrivivax sp.]
MSATFHVSIACDSAAIADDPGAELARILHGLARVLADAELRARPLSRWSLLLRDADWNTVGSARFTDDGGEP